MEQLTAKAPTRSSWQRDLAVSHGKVGLALVAQGNAGAAQEEIRAGLEIIAPLAARDPSNAHCQQDLAELHRESGDAAEAAADSAGAHEEYEACVAIIDPVLWRGSTNKKLAELASYCRSHATAAGNGQGRAEVGRASAP